MATRMVQLAQPKPNLLRFPDRSSPQWETAVASPRVCQLACPKWRQGLYSPKTSLAPPHPAATSSRLQLLAIPKSDHPQYAQDRPVSWPVPGPVRKAVASERVQVLSQPNQRKALFQGYNPYTVTLAARSASASPRLQELCLPMPRKCKGK
ncbi:testicular haploid expressed gene protein-like [Salmo trutta]|uniref:testicular haploid expressed gene protein-like n=1 Tax=Salmo trutta TaxID=8032 RepID=UPI001130F281|nr:testicular haploid expressed gene protein-like [Salmo trutta]